MKFTKKYFQKNKELKIGIIILVSWRLFLFFPIFVSQYLFPLAETYLGGGSKWYLTNPYLYGWVNFDGMHYITIAQNGYGQYEYFFFPIYPKLISFFSSFFNNTLYSNLVFSLLISNLSFLISIFGFWKLLRLDYNKKFSTLCILTLFTFPTSFFFGSGYTESMFFCFLIWSFYLARTKKFLYASFFGMIASATRIIGILLLPALLIEIWKSKDTRDKKIKNSLYLLLVPLGLLSFMFYLKEKTGDPLIFVHAINIFGDQRSSHFILLPQVFFRYFFKIIPSLTLSYFQANFLTLIELVTGILLLSLSIVSFFRLRLSYSIYLATGYIIPTLTGSFSSLPRYMIVLFPAFILLARFLDNKTEFQKILFFAISLFLLTISESIFMRGYFLS